jgi:hypothetical protein
MTEVIRRSIDVGGDHIRLHLVVAEFRPRAGVIDRAKL